MQVWNLWSGSCKAVGGYGVLQDKPLNLTVQRCLRLFPPCAEGRLEYLRLRNAFDLPMDCLHLLDTDASAAEAAELPAIIEAIGAPKVSDPWL